MVQTPRLRAFETNERRIGNFVGTMDPYFVGRNAAVLQYTRFAYTDQATRRRISNAATPKPGRFDEEWKELGLAPMRMRGRTELPEASLILTSVKKEMKVGGILQTRTFLAPFGCEEIKVVHGEEEDKSAGTLLIPRFQEEADNDEQGPSSSNKDKSEGDDGQGGSRQTEEPMQQDQAGGEDDRASTGGTSSLDFNIFSDLENNADTLETFWTQEVKGQEGFERTDSMLEGLGAGWTASFLAKVYPKVSHYLIKEFLQAVVRVSIVELIALFVTFGAESFVKGPAILLTDGIQNLRLDGLLTLIAITHGNLGGLMKLARCPEQMKERVRNLDMKKSTDSWNKIRDLRHTLIQYLLQQNRFGTGEDETIEREEDVRRHVGGMPLLTDLSLAMRTDPLALIRGVTEFVTVIYGPAVTFAFPDVKVEAYRRSVLHLNRYIAHTEIPGRSRQ